VIDDLPLDFHHITQAGKEIGDDLVLDDFGETDKIVVQEFLVLDGRVRAKSESGLRILVEAVVPAVFVVRVYPTAGRPEKVGFITRESSSLFFDGCLGRNIFFTTSVISTSFT
jgi:hypothetical protein